MSGGEFGYVQYKLEDCASQIESLIEGYSKTCDTKTMNRFKKTVKLSRSVAAMVNRIDYFVSCDDGEETFNKRWDEEIENE